MATGAWHPRRHRVRHRSHRAVYGGDRAREGAYFFHQDHIDSARLITNNVGKVIGRHDYLPFGGAMGPQSSAKFSNDIRFGGHRAEEETGLTYMGARYCDAEL